MPSRQNRGQPQETGADLALVRAGEQQHRDADNVVLGQQARVWRVRLSGATTHKCLDPRKPVFTACQLYVQDSSGKCSMQAQPASARRRSSPGTRTGMSQGRPAQPARCPAPGHTSLTPPSPRK